MRWLIVLGLLFIAACTASVQTECPEGDDLCIIKQASASEAELCQQLPESKQSWCYTEVALAQQDTMHCGNILDEREEAFCVSQVATQELDVSTCEAIDIAAAKDQCLFEIAQNTTESELCAGIANMEYGDDCAYEIALDTTDPDACQYIEDIPYNTRCYIFMASDTEDWTVCDNIEGQFRDWCVMNLAAKLKDPSLCTEIDNVTVYSACLSVLEQ